MTRSDLPCIEQSNHLSEPVYWISHTPRMQARRVNSGQKKAFHALIPLISLWLAGGCAKHPATWQISSSYFLNIECDKEFPSQFHQVTPASWMLMRYSKSRRIFSVMICLKGMMDVWWVETHEIPWVWFKDLMFQGIQGIYQAIFCYVFTMAN